MKDIDTSDDKPKPIGDMELTSPVISNILPLPLSLRTPASKNVPIAAPPPKDRTSKASKNSSSDPRLSLVSTGRIESNDMTNAQWKATKIMKMPKIKRNPMISLHFPF